MTLPTPSSSPSSSAAPPTQASQLTGNVILVLAVLAALALTVTGWLSYSAADDASDALMRAEAQQVAVAVQRELGMSMARDHETDAAAVLATYSEDGLRYLGIRGGPEGDLVDVAGTAAAAGYALGDSPPVPRRGSRLTVLDGAVRVHMPPRARRGKRGRRHRRGGPPIIVEVEAKLASSVGSHATQTLIINLMAALLCLVGGILLRWLWNRRVVLQARLADKRQLESLGEMAAVLAHEMRNPLASLKGNLQLLAERFRDDERAHSKIERVVGEATRLEHLTNSLLTFIRSGRIQLTDGDPTAIVQRVRERTSAIAVHISSAGAPARWPMDPDRIEEAMTNLLVNAVEVSPDADSVEVKLVEQGGYLVISVRDHGPGFEGDIDRLFEPFTTTKTRGTGLGLAVSRQIAEAHGGSLTGSNHPSGGAVLVLRLPNRRPKS